MAQVLTLIAALGFSRSLSGALLGPTRHAGARCVTMSSSEPSNELARVRAMPTADIKAELELRKVDFAGCFEKDDLVRRLVLSREQGEADPTLVDKFNSDLLERSFRKSDGTSEDDLFDNSAVEGVEVLPGGMSPEMLQKLASNPKMMSVLQSPRMQVVLKDVMASGPEAFKKYAGDAEVMELIMTFQQAMS
ncbi:hypothetical protein T492DRAFT_1142148 [Pavlovales sp. CCMP2436]|nr:hypothetical protein T492DRAFT_1142148 [Pavlovales sp. CCMP2436]|mmetsp:Transcript_22726/g.57699  ORF Transcript_22726/g.57699 Transcript_22726/m.57699 type:complete len:192 (-) Transcript_22726:166-741(-)|eukprot:CAMPEP_0179908510 /NCGR_PEP_ID=MMETSP0982-20121206/44592_1 /TAXON_ID=483367 /ORGANISM="non described non described, Strain CCMP 2436" /LENGTH=191 /DNA_ID=CAMNT_0021809641 /DNA_START=39 /DNA_END=614 /DNA_ORIENTATION=-